MDLREMVVSTSMPLYIYRRDKAHKYRHFNRGSDREAIGTSKAYGEWTGTRRKGHRFQNKLRMAPGTRDIRWQNKLCVALTRLSQLSNSQPPLTQHHYSLLSPAPITQVHESPTCDEPWRCHAITRANTVYPPFICLYAHFYQCTGLLSLCCDSLLVDDVVVPTGGDGWTVPPWNGFLKTCTLDPRGRQATINSKSDETLGRE